MKKNNESNHSLSKPPTTKAYSRETPRLCKVDGSIKSYNFCSPTYTEHNGGSSLGVPGAPKLEYIGKGTIYKIDGELYDGPDRNEEVHFWKIVSQMPHE